MRRSSQSLIILVLILGLTACSPSSRGENSGLCGALPFEIGLQVELPLIPITVLIDSQGVDFRTEGTFSIDFLIFELSPYAEFDTSGVSTSPCLKVEIYNPEWDGEYQRFIVNFNKDNFFRVLVRTEQETEFVFSRERWLAYPPGGDEFIQYTYSTNTLYINAANDRVKEFTITAEIPGPGKAANFCSDEYLQRNTSIFINPLKYIPAYFQDVVNSTRETFRDKLGGLGGGILILAILLVGIVLSVKSIFQKVRLREQFSWIWLTQRLLFLFLWTYFWFVVFTALPACWA